MLYRGALISGFWFVIVICLVAAIGGFDWFSGFDFVLGYVVWGYGCCVLALEFGGLNSVALWRMSFRWAAYFGLLVCRGVWWLNVVVCGFMLIVLLFQVLLFYVVMLFGCVLIVGACIGDLDSSCIVLFFVVVLCLLVVLILGTG